MKFNRIPASFPFHRARPEDRKRDVRTTRGSRLVSRTIVISSSIEDDTVPLAFDYYTIEQLLMRRANQMMARRCGKRLRREEPRRP